MHAWAWKQIMIETNQFFLLIFAATLYTDSAWSILTYYYYTV